MPEQYEYLDEHGNPIDPSEIDGDYEIIEEIEEVVAEEPAAAVSAPAPETTVDSAPSGSAPAPRLSKAVLAIGAVAVLGVGGVVAYGLSQIGNQSTAQDVKDAAKSKAAAASSSVAAKSSEVANRPVDACRDLPQAVWRGGGGAPRMQLKIVSTAPLPAEFVRRHATVPQKGRFSRNKGEATTPITMLQTAKGAFGLYLPEPAPAKGEAQQPQSEPWYKVAVDTTGDKVAVDEIGPWPGTDKNVAGACEQGDPGAYAVVGDVPAGAEGLADGQAQVDAIQADGSSETRVVAVMGDSVVTADLQYTPADEEAEK